MVVMNIFSKNSLFLGVALMAISLSPAVSNAQELDLGEFLKTEEPQQDVLQDSSSVVEEVVTTATVPEMKGEDVVSEDVEEDNPLNLQPATLDTTVGDALPVVPDARLRVEDTGLDISAIDGVRTPISSSLDIDLKSPEELAEEIRREAFDAAITGLFPMRPGEIKEVLKKYDATTHAAEDPVFGVPKPIVSVETISLDHWRF